VAQQIAGQFDCIDRSLHSQAAQHPNTDAVVAAPETIENVNFLYADANILPNVVTAKYYGLASIRSSATGPCQIPDH
jgi:hypothetical protein